MCVSTLQRTQAIPTLTIQQPWAGAIIAGLKTIENRSWSPPPNLVGTTSRLAIHAGKTRVKNAIPQELLEKVDPKYLKPGVVLGTVRVQKVVQDPTQLPLDEKKWWLGPLGWQLTDAHPFDVPIPHLGQLRIWYFNLPVD